MKIIKNAFDSRLTAVLAGAAVIAVLGASAGYAAGEIGSDGIKDNSIRSKDVKDGTLKDKDLSSGLLAQLKGAVGAAGATGARGVTGATGTAGAAGVAGPVGPQGMVGPEGAPGADGTAVYAGPSWSVVDRNTIGNGDASLRAGPDAAPMGVGSLGLRTGGTGDAAAFGNQIDFVGTPLADVGSLSYSIYTTNENIEVGDGTVNLPNLSFEVDPTGVEDTDGPNYSSLVFVPGAQEAGWASHDATEGERFFMTGAAGEDSGCTQSAHCSLAEVNDAFPDASLITVQFMKGRDFAFSGAVDMLQINDDVFDFEPFGVTTSAVPTT